MSAVHSQTCQLRQLQTRLTGFQLKCKLLCLPSLGRSAVLRKGSRSSRKPATSATSTVGIPSSASPAKSASLQDEAESDYELDSSTRANWAPQEEAQIAVSSPEVEGYGSKQQAPLHAHRSAVAPPTGLGGLELGRLSAKDLPPWGVPALVAAAAMLGVAVLLSAITNYRKRTDPEEIAKANRVKRKKDVARNKELVETLRQYLPDNRLGLTTGVVGQLMRKTRFTAVEVFRKFLWYLLRERPFDPPAVEDVVFLKAVLNLNDEEVAAALRERAKRIYDKYGNVMLETEGMTKAGVERKATARALFSKLLFLAEYEALIAQESEAAKTVDIPGVFGATTSDTDALRIVSIYDVSLDNLEGQFSKNEEDE